MLSERVKALEEEVYYLRSVKVQAKQILSEFISTYHSEDHEFRMPKNRQYHTKQLEVLLERLSSGGVRNE